jgi:hypothetical protein
MTIDEKVAAQIIVDLGYIIENMILNIGDERFKDRVTSLK